jgi:hypothetical protein
VAVIDDRPVRGTGIVDDGAAVSRQLFERGAEVEHCVGAVVGVALR